MRTRTSNAIVMPIDLCRLNQKARAPTGCFGISIIHQPRINCATTSAAISQWSVTATFV